MKIDEEHAFQYEFPRAEVMATVAEARRLETLSVGAVAALYAWLAIHLDKVPYEA
jgi:hypothetical protein